MTQIHWAAAVDGDFNVAANWTPGRVPIADMTHKDGAILDAAGGAYTVTLSQDWKVESLQTAANATLAIDAANFITFAGTGKGANAGTISINQDGKLSLFGLDNQTFDNTGRILLNPGSGSAFLDIFFTVALKGGGDVVMADSASSVIFSDGQSVVTLSNVDNTISGAGTIGDAGVGPGGGLTLINGAAGVIDATGSINTLVLDTAGVTFTNSGLAEGTGAAGLTISSTTVDQSGGGTILAAKGSNVHLEFTVIEGGTLQSTGSGVVQATGNNTFDGTASMLSIRGKVDVGDGGDLTLRGVIGNAGVVALMGTAAGANVTVAGNLTLQGGGVLSLSDFAGDIVSGVKTTTRLTNVDNSITGDGALGGGSLILSNRAKGTIVETGTSGLIIDTGSATISNAGLIEGAGSGGLFVESAVTNSGVIEAAGSGGVSLFAAVANNGMLEVKSGALTAYDAVSGTGSATIGGGTLYFAAAFNQNVTFTGKTGTLELARSQSYGGSVSGFSKSGKTFFDLRDIGFVGANEATFVDNGSHTGGVLTVTDGTHTAHITLVGDYHASTFIAADDGQGGVSVHDPATASAAPSPDAAPFIAAMAGWGSKPEAVAPSIAPQCHSRTTMVALPRPAIA